MRKTKDIHGENTMSKLKILFISEYFYPHGIGGGERSALKLALALTKKGQDVSIQKRRTKWKKQKK